MKSEQTKGERGKEAKAQNWKFVLTDIELLALTDTLDTISAISDSLEDDGSLKKDIKLLDKMLLRHGFKRNFK